MLMPIFDEASDEVTKAGYDTGKVVMGKVDCDKEGAVATRFHITKYPTLKMFRNGMPAKKEYRGETHKIVSNLNSIQLPVTIQEKINKKPNWFLQNLIIMFTHYFCFILVLGDNF